MNLNLIFLFYGFNICIHCVQNQLIDLRNDCKNDLKLNYFLTYGMGYIDGTIISINSIEKNCSLYFHSEPKIMNMNIFQVIVVEYLKTAPITEMFKQQHLKRNNNLILEHSRNITNIGKQMKRYGVFVGTFFERRTSILLHGESPAMKITATAAKCNVALGDHTKLINDTISCLENETKCRIGDKTFCIDKEMICDGNINCGTEGLNDESHTACAPEKRTKHFLVVITGCIVLTFLITSLVILYDKTIPKIPKMYFQITNRDNKLHLSRNNRCISLTNKNIKITQPKSPRVLYKYRSSGEHLEESDIEMNSHFYTSGKSPRLGNSERLTTNSPVLARPKKDQYVKESFGREIWYLSVSGSARHKIKKESTIFFTS